MDDLPLTRVRGIRGATTVEHNTREAIVEAAHELLDVLVQRNDVDPSHVASAWFTTTMDLDAEFPAVAAREMGWDNVALMCSHEMRVPGSLERCLRILVHLNTEKDQADMQHVYLHGAKVLRPDVAGDQKAGDDGSDQEDEPQE
jgi:chorismate mutase